MVKGVFILFALVLCSQNKPVRPDDVGSYYVAAYLKSDFEDIIILKKDFPTQSDTIYKRENDVVKIVEFHSNGNLTLRELPDSYFCGDLQRISGGEGSWKRLNEKEIDIVWRGKTGLGNFEIKQKYRVDSQKNGNKILTPIS